MRPPILDAFAALRLDLPRASFTAHTSYHEDHTFSLPVGPVILPQMSSSTLVLSSTTDPRWMQKRKNPPRRR